MAKLTDRKGVLKKVLRYVRRYWGALLFSLVLALVYVAMSLYIPILVGKAIDHIIAAGKVDLDELRRNSGRCAREVLDYRVLAARIYR